MNSFPFILSPTSFVFHIQHKQNKFQFSWLWKKVYGLKGTVREFLDNHQYNSQGILKYERIFGKGFISAGGLYTTKVQNWLL